MEKHKIGPGRPSPLCRIVLSLSYEAYTSVISPRYHSKSAADATATGSAKLFADAERYENETTSKSAGRTLSIPEQQEEHWTGDEKIQDTTLRMLVDKYKPLRTGSIQSADEKMKKALPSVCTLPTSDGREQATGSASFPKPSSGSWETEPLLPSGPDHQPWHTTFRAPSYSIKLAQIPGPSISSKSPSLELIDGQSKKLTNEQKKNAQHIERLSLARESTLDYRMGVRKGGQGNRNPVMLKGWTSLVEEKIEKARQAGLFKNVKGHGRPLVQSFEEHNPFLARDEFLMNRIVKRNGAAPPWVLIQGELEAAVENFRRILRQAWIRRTVRMLTLTHPYPITLEDIKAHRDPEWIQREKSYHETVIKELNDLVRNYNGIAPYSVRRSYYLREVEVEKLYVDCAEEILASITESRNEGVGPDFVSEDDIITFAKFQGQGLLQLWRWLRNVLRRLRDIW